MDGITRTSFHFYIYRYILNDDVKFCQDADALKREGRIGFIEHTSLRPRCICTLIQNMCPSGTATNSILCQF